MASNTFGESAGPLSRPSVVDGLAGVLSGLILSTELSPGTKLTEESVAATYGVSRSTVAAAIQVLVRHRLVTKLPNHTPEVRTVTEDDYQDLLVFRRVIDRATMEVFTGRDSTGKLPGQTREELNASIQDLLLGGRMADKGVISHEIAFHDVLSAATGSPQIQRVHSSHTKEFQLALTTLEKPLEVSPIATQHVAIANALYQGDRAAASAAIETHLDYLRTV